MPVGKDISVEQLPELVNAKKKDYQVFINALHFLQQQCNQASHKIAFRNYKKPHEID